jgi:hypothetical protein
MIFRLGKLHMATIGNGVGVVCGSKSMLCWSKRFACKKVENLSPVQASLIAKASKPLKAVKNEVWMSINRFRDVNVISL